MLSWRVGVGREGVVCLRIGVEDCVGMWVRENRADWVCGCRVEGDWVWGDKKACGLGLVSVWAWEGF